jgi:hypothetical protein
MARRNIKQLRAIYYSTMKKKIAHYEELIKSNGLEEDFKKSFREWADTHHQKNLYYTIYLRKHNIKY